MRLYENAVYANEWGNENESNRPVVPYRIGYPQRLIGNRNGSLETFANVLRPEKSCLSTDANVSVLVSDLPREKKKRSCSAVARTKGNMP